MGKGGHQGGQPPYLDQILPDGSYARKDAFGFPGSPNFPNFTNRINPGTIPNVFVENFIAELDEAEEYFIDEEEGMLYLAFNGTGAPPTGNASRLGVVMLQNLLSIRGEGAEPEAKAVPTALARDITIRNAAPHLACAAVPIACHAVLPDASLPACRVLPPCLCLSHPVRPVSRLILCLLLPPPS